MRLDGWTLRRRTVDTGRRVPVEPTQRHASSTLIRLSLRTRRPRCPPPSLLIVFHPDLGARRAARDRSGVRCAGAGSRDGRRLHRRRRLPGQRERRSGRPRGARSRSRTPTRSPATVCNVGECDSQGIVVAALVHGLRTRRGTCKAPDLGVFSVASSATRSRSVAAAPTRSSRASRSPTPMPAEGSLRLTPRRRRAGASARRRRPPRRASSRWRSACSSSPRSTPTRAAPDRADAAVGRRPRRSSCDRRADSRTASGRDSDDGAPTRARRSRRPAPAPPPVPPPPPVAPAAWTTSSATTPNKLQFARARQLGGQRPVRRGEDDAQTSSCMFQLCNPVGPEGPHEDHPAARTSQRATRRMTTPAARGCQAAPGQGPVATRSACAGSRRRQAGGALRAGAQEQGARHAVTDDAQPVTARRPLPLLRGPGAAGEADGHAARPVHVDDAPKDDRGRPALQPRGERQRQPRAPLRSAHLVCYSIKGRGGVHAGGRHHPRPLRARGARSAGRRPSACRRSRRSCRRRPAAAAPAGPRSLQVLRLRATAVPAALRRVARPVRAVRRPGHQDAAALQPGEQEQRQGHQQERRTSSATRRRRSGPCRSQPREVRVSNQFGVRQLSVVRPVELCVPSLKRKGAGRRADGPEPDARPRPLPLLRRQAADGGEDGEARRPVQDDEDEGAAGRAAVQPDAQEQRGGASPAGAPRLLLDQRGAVPAARGDRAQPVRRGW